MPIYYYAIHLARVTTATCNTICLSCYFHAELLKHSSGKKPRYGIRVGVDHLYII